MKCRSHPICAPPPTYVRTFRNTGKPHAYDKHSSVGTRRCTKRSKTLTVLFSVCTASTRRAQQCSRPGTLASRPGVSMLSVAPVKPSQHGRGCLSGFTRKPQPRLPGSASAAAAATAKRQPTVPSGHSTGFTNQLVQLGFY